VTTDVRYARAADLRHVAEIEDSGGQQFEELFGDRMVPALRAPAISGADRASRPGFLLVAGDPPVGFVHVLVIDGHAHLEQISVRPGQQRQGIGASLVRAAIRESRAAGHRELSLCTYRDVPWNGPFYRSLGFTEVTRLLPFQKQAQEHEVALGLDVNGSRVVMSVDLTREVTDE
jgi:GNAT superfamily N-acetyltransferase